MRNTIIFIFGLLCATWFALTGWIWVFWGALFISYPVGAISLLCWVKIQDENSRRTKFIPLILSVGVTLSLLVLICLLITN